tara:strand:+ start:1290 stop:1478 length:189 start_codon:yes stop_codon:yes gene_type:complete
MGSPPKPPPPPPPPPPPAPPVQRRDVSAQVTMAKKAAGQRQGYQSTILTERPLGGSGNQTLG